MEHPIGVGLSRDVFLAVCGYDAGAAEHSVHGGGRRYGGESGDKRPDDPLII